MGFTAILALFGVFAIAIPIVIHLNKAKQAPVVWVGNIRLLKGQDTKRFRPTNIDNWPLFILRVLIVLAITLAAAKPYRQGDYIDNQPLALVSPNWLVTASDEQIERISKQYDIAHLSWNALIHKNRLAHEQPTKAHHTNNLWALLSYYDEIQPQSQPFHVFVNDRLAPWFTQNRPEFSRELIWHIQVDDNPAQTPQAVIIADNRQLAGLSVLTEGLALLGYEVGFESTTSYKSNNKADVIFNLVNDIAINASHNNDSVIITGSKWLQGYQSVDFIFTLRQLIAAAYLDKLPPNLAHGTINAEQLTVSANPTLYPQSIKQRYFEHYLVVLLLILSMCERLLSEFGQYRHGDKNKDENSVKGGKDDT